MSKPYGSRKTKTKSYDVIIIGGGVAGMYACYQLCKKYKGISVKILEKNAYLGGRVKMKEFHNKTVNLGAGIIKDRDKRFKKLLKELNIKMTNFWTHSEYSFDDKLGDDEMRAIVKKLQTSLHVAATTDTVHQYLIKVLGQEPTAKLILMAGYHDFLNEPALEYFQKEDVNELFFDWKAVSIDWKSFIQKLSACVDADLETEVESIQNIELDDFEKSTYFLLSAKYKNLSRTLTYSCERLIIATTVNDVIKLLPDKIELYQPYIKGQPFFRVYGKISSSEPITNSTLVTNNILMKIIPIHGCIYMIGYNDGEYAVRLHGISKQLKTKKEKIAFYDKLLHDVIVDKKFRLVDIDECFWELGTHYFTPFENRDELLRLQQYPRKNVIVVGEMVSTNQGWVEGALESVDKVIK